MTLEVGSTMSDARCQKYEARSLKYNVGCSVLDVRSMKSEVRPNKVISDYNLTMKLRSILSKEVL